MFQMLMELRDFYPENRGYISHEEMSIIRDTLNIRDRDVLSLRNLRNFVVLFYSRDREGNSLDVTMRESDKMSAICGVIDSALFALGAEV